MQAQRTDSIIITKDADFSTAAILSTGCRVVWLRFGNSTTAFLLKKLDTTFAEVEQSLEEGQSLIEVHE